MRVRAAFSWRLQRPDLLADWIGGLSLRFDVLWPGAVEGGVLEQTVFAGEGRVLSSQVHVFPAKRIEVCSQGLGLAGFVTGFVTPWRSRNRRTRSAPVIADLPIGRLPIAPPHTVTVNIATIWTKPRFRFKGA